MATLPDTPAMPETLWCCASTTKAHVAAALAGTIDAKKHPALEAKGWNTPIASVLQRTLCWRTSVPWRTPRLWTRRATVLA